MKILALDQSTNVNGYSIWNNDELSAFGHFKSQGEKSILKMEDIYLQIKELIKNNAPDYVVIEGVQFQKNYKVYSILSQLQGMLFSLFFQEDTPFFVVEPTSWKSFSKLNLKNKREEQKKEAIETVKNLFGKVVTEDEADAILLGRYACSFVKEIKDEKN